MNGVLLKSTLVVIFWFRRTSAMMVHGIGRTITTDLEDYHKVTIILIVRDITSRYEPASVNRLVIIIWL